MSAQHFAFIAVITAALDGIVYRYTMKRGGCPWGTLIFFHLVSLILLLPFIEIPSFLELPASAQALLLLSSVFWVMADLNGVRAYEHLDATVCEVYGSLQLIFITLAGVLLFHENIGVWAVLGITLILASVALQLNFDAIEWNKGISYMLVYVVFSTAALVLDKALTSMVSEGAIVFYGFLLPTFLYSSFGARHIKNIIPSLRKSKFIFLACPILGVISYSALIQAFSIGDLSITYIIQQTGIIFVFVFEVLLLGTYQNFRQRALCCTVCALGAFLVCGMS